MKVIQYDFLDGRPLYVQDLDHKIDVCIESCTKVRKSLFARDNKQDKRLNDLEERLALLERNICIGVEK